MPQVYDQLDGFTRLLSLLYKNQTNLGNTHVVIKKLVGYYKYVWYRNQLLKEQFNNLVKEFEAIGVTKHYTKNYPDLISIAVKKAWQKIMGQSGSKQR